MHPGEQQRAFTTLARDSPEAQKRAAEVMEAVGTGAIEVTRHVNYPGNLQHQVGEMFFSLGVAYLIATQEYDQELKRTRFGLVIMKFEKLV